MRRSEAITQMQALFKETGAAHHQAFQQTNGTDPEWPIWYADYLYHKLDGLLGATLTRSDLIYLLVWLDKHQDLHAPGANWTRYYARTLAELYL